MGKGDKKTTRGKIFQGSYGILRPRNKKKSAPKIVEKVVEVEVEAPPVKPKRTKKEPKKKES
jgi:30S ribosomal protein S31